MRNHLKVILPVLVLTAFILTGCAQVQEAITKDPIGFIKSVGKVGQAAGAAGREITEEQELYLGRTVSARILKQYPLLNNNRIHKYVNLVGTTVALQSDRPDLHFHFAVLNTDEVNAFAAPGGFVFITYGMLKSMKNEEELAAVLAHEVGHVCARHSLGIIKSAMWKRVAVITAQETARHGGVNPELLGLFGQATDKIVGALVTVGYSQQQEFEADSLGQVYAGRAGYQSSATREYLALMNVKAAGHDQTLNARLGTHPSFDARLNKLPPVEGGISDPKSVDFRKNRFNASVK